MLGAWITAEQIVGLGWTTALIVMAGVVIWMFIATVIINSAGILPSTVRDGATSISQCCLVVAIAALGMKTTFRQLTQTGWKPLVLILAETTWLAAFVLVCALVFNR